MVNNELNDKLQKLISDYSQKLPAKLQKLHADWGQLQAKWSEVGFEDFHREVHSLTGAAGTYGFPLLSHASRQLEMYLRILKEQGLSLTSEQKKEITILLNNLHPDVVAQEKEFFPHQNKVKQNKLIYCVEPDAAVFENLKLELKDPGYELIQLTNMDALEKAEKEKKSLVMIVDMDNADVSMLRKLSEVRKQNAAPLLCIASKDELLTRLQAVRAGSTGFFKKPVDIFHLTKMLNQFFESDKNDPYRILIVDDSETLSAYHALILQEAGMKTEILNKPLLLMPKLIEFQPDILLMDIYMPECTGLELAAVLRQQANYTSLPIIFLSSEEDRFKQLSALNLGGDDFLTKPILPQHLVAAVRSRAKRAGILSAVMMRDSLTELLNHTTILQNVGIELSHAKAHNRPLSLVILDIDFFKTINDTHGHPMGDYVLRKLSELLLSQLRASDLVGRYGGDEFAIVLPNTDKAMSIKLCERIREQFACLHFSAAEGEISVSFSMGIATSSPTDTAESLIAAADKALYLAKKEGRNRVKHING